MRPELADALDRENIQLRYHTFTDPNVYAVAAIMPASRHIILRPGMDKPLSDAMVAHQIGHFVDGSVGDGICTPPDQPVSTTELVAWSYAARLLIPCVRWNDPAKIDKSVPELARVFEVPPWLVVLGLRSMLLTPPHAGPVLVTSRPA